MKMGPFSENAGASKPVEYVGGELRQIGLVLCDRFSLADTAIVVEAFHALNTTMARYGKHAVRYNVRLLSAAGGRMTSASSVCVWTNSVESHVAAAPLRAIIFSGGSGIRDALRSDPFLGWLHRAQASCKQFLAIGESSAVLAHLGSFRRDIALASSNGRSFINVQSQALPADSAISAAVAVIEREHGEVIAAQIAKSIDPEFGSGLTDDIRRGVAATLSQPIQDAAQWMCANGDRDISLDEAAQIAAMSGRNFLRRFKLEVGMKPSEYLLKVRLDMACRLLTQTRLPVEKIARRCGINGGGRLSKLFREHLQLTPTEYRAERSDVQRDRKQSTEVERQSSAPFLVSENPREFSGVRGAGGE
ncbi:GlxA family transcriptional regulator [Paraburkholderia unamae]|uniref:GlxA family transcriptional regulator n=1 Tax=Paraburkholderia unamae TaxID=219649 RepID=UPI000DD2E858|nr:helix-turn-helix domain-containing protein [Paraburkholderia unamae]